MPHFSDIVRLLEAEESLPMDLGPDEEAHGASSSSGLQPDPWNVGHLTNEERLALKLATSRPRNGPEMAPKELETAENPARNGQTWLKHALT